MVRSKSLEQSSSQEEVQDEVWYRCVTYRVPAKSEGRSLLYQRIVRGGQSSSGVSWLSVTDIFLPEK